VRGKGIIKFVIGSLILTVILWGLIAYGPSIVRRIQEATSGTLSVGEVVEHSNKYLNQQITVKGQIILGAGQSYLDNKFVGFVSEYTGDKLYHLHFENSPANTPLIQNSWYKFTGTLRIKDSTLVYLDVISVEPA